MNKRKILLKLAVCVAFGITLLAITAAPSLAGNFNQNGALIGSQQNPANAAITKCFAMGQETVTPNITFIFQITKVSFNDQTTPEALAAMPIIGTPAGGNNGTVTVTYTPSDVYNAGNNMTVRANQTDYIYKETQALFPSSVQWIRTGIYCYRITELQTTNYNIYDTTRETLTLSKAQYDLVVCVAEREPKTVPTQYYVWAISAYYMINDEGNPRGHYYDPIFKVNPQPGGPTGGGGTGPYSQMIFTNKYLRHGSNNPPVNPNNDHKFKISKTVTSIGADSGLYFNFDVTIQKPIISTKNTYRVYVYEGNSNNYLPYSSILANVQNTTLANYAGYIDMPIGIPVRFMLKHNQYLAFTNIDAGATYVINELGTVDYTPSYSIYKGNNIIPVQSQAGMMSGSLSTPTIPPVTVTINPNNLWTDKAEFNNKYKVIIPTGIAVDNIPYFALIAAAVIALSGYMIFKIRRRKNGDTAVETGY